MNSRKLPSALMITLCLLLSYQPLLTGAADKKEQSIEVGEASYNIADCKPANEAEIPEGNESSDVQKLDLDKCKKVKK